MKTVKQRNSETKEKEKPMDETIDKDLTYVNADGRREGVLLKHRGKFFAYRRRECLGEFDGKKEARQAILKELRKINLANVKPKAEKRKVGRPKKSA